MHRYLFTLLITCISQLSFSQISTVNGRITDGKSGEPMPFVHITINGSKEGTTTDIDGNFSIHSSSEISYLDFSFIGYEKKRVEIENPSGFLNISLHEKADQLQEVTVFPGENPAHRIIENAVKNRKQNDPMNIPAFQYKTYSKFIISANVDSVDPSIDTIHRELKDTSFTKIDSSNYKLVQLVNSQHFFFMESVTERNYLAPSRDNETVLANRTSGFKNPLFSLIATQMQSFTFYEDYVSIAGSEYLNPITPGSTSRYFFILEDTLFQPAGDSIFIISFRPRPNYGFQPLKGLLHINSTDWAVQSALAEPYEAGGMQISIEQQYERYGEHTWFPKQLNAQISFNNISINNGAILYGQMRTYLKDISLNPELKRKNISRADMSIAEDAVRNSASLLEKYRNDTLSDKERKTYHVMDSIGEAEDLDMKLKIAAAVLRGKVPLWIVDLEIDKVFRYNDYEGIRLGLGGHTNSRFSEWFTLGGYFAYGFKDELWKYGWDTKISLHKHSNLSIIGGYQLDIFETGGVDFLQKYKPSLLQDNYRLLYIRQWDEVTRYHAGITYDILPKIHAEVRLQRENRYTYGDYYFSYLQDGEAVLQNGFNYTELITSLRYVPNEKYIEGPGFGKITYQMKYPIIYLQHTRGIKDVLDSYFEYHKLDARFEYQYKTIRAGTFSMNVQGGIVFSDLPFSKLYSNPANLIDSERFSKRALNFADRNSFETMRFNEFMNDRYVQVMLRQDLKSLLFRREQFAPHIEIVSRAMWGNLNAPQLHHNVSTTSLEEGYYESGLELNRLYTDKIGLGLGLGFYYRYGPYTLPSFEDNVAIKLTSKFQL